MNERFVEFNCHLRNTMYSRAKNIIFTSQLLNFQIWLVTRALDRSMNEMILNQNPYLTVIFVAKRQCCCKLAANKFVHKGKHSFINSHMVCHATYMNLTASSCEIAVNWIVRREITRNIKANLLFVESSQKQLK